MPWDARGMASHNHALHGEKAGHAARIANAVLKSSGDEGMALAVANKWAGKHRADGGMMNDNGPIEPTAQTTSPNYQANLQKFSQLPTEKLRELAVRTGTSPQGGIIRQLLRQRNMGMAETNPAMPGMLGMAPPSGAIQGYDAGGAMPSTAPLMGPEKPMTGYLEGHTSGRADAIKGTAMPDSYILPSEEVAYIGEGNGLNGARAIQRMLSTGPRGIALPAMHGSGRGLPRPPTGQEAPQAPEALAEGGVANDNAAAEHQPVALSHGEFSFTPEQVQWVFGDGDMARGKRVLDLFTMILRKRHIKKLKELKGPVGAKAA